MDVREIAISAFDKENSEELKERLIALLPEELQKKENILKQEQAQGFNEKTINILNISLTKKRETRLMLDHLLELLGSSRLQLERELDSRLDDELNFFIRLDKDAWRHDEVKIVEHGNCIHIKIGIITYPRKREEALVQLASWLEAKGF